MAPPAGERTPVARDHRVGTGVRSTCMCGRLRDPYPPSPLVRFRVSGSAAARRVATPPPTRTSVNPVRSYARSGDRSASSYEQLSMILVCNSIRRSKRCGSQKWEPTCSAALRRSTTRSDSCHRSRTPSSTQSDRDRQPKRLRNSLTRKRSLVQIQYGLPSQAAAQATYTRAQVSCS